MSPLGRPPVYPDIVEEHFEELDFLWEQREANLSTPDWTLEDLAEHEERAEAHLDGLRLAELHAVDLALERVRGGEAFAATAAALVLLETGEPELRGKVLDAFRSGEAPAVEGIRIALRHADVSGFGPALEETVGSPDPFRASAAADVLAFHRLDVSGLERLLGLGEPGARVLSLGAAARLGRVFPREIAAAVEAPEPEVRRAALHAAARLAVPGIGRHCRAAASREADPDPEAVYFLGLLGGPADLPLLQELTLRPDTAKAAVAALGAMGRVEAVPFLLGLMAHEALGIAATASYKRITGAQDVEGVRPFPPPQVPEGEDEEEALPPDPEKARADWRRREGHMSPEVAWQAGVPLPEDYFPGTDSRFSLETRRDLYLRLRARMGSAVPDQELEALAWRQRSGSVPGEGGG